MVQAVVVSRLEYGKVCVCVCLSLSLRLAKLGHSDKNYYTFRPVDGFRVIVLDTLDVSLLGLDEESTDYEETMKLLRKYNPNKDLNDSSGNYSL